LTPASRSSTQIDYPFLPYANKTNKTKTKTKNKKQKTKNKTKYKNKKKYKIRKESITEPKCPNLRTGHIQNLFAVT
jgi:hypothetical protein